MLTCLYFTYKKSVILLLQTIIDSPVHPVTAISPLTFVICVTAIKQGYEDWLRHKSDDMVNNRPVKIVKEGDVEVCVNFKQRIISF